MTYFHGGEPNLKPGDDLWPASRLGRYFIFGNDSVSGPVLYDPNYFYFTTHLGLARAYAARCLSNGVPTPGTVYQVEPVGPVFQDPDYQGAGPDKFLMTRHARVVAVAETDVDLTVREQNRASWPYLFWNSASHPRYASDGTLVLSAEMVGYGVTQDYAALLPKWIDLREINPSGGIVSADDYSRPASAAELLDAFAHLGLDSDPAHQTLFINDPSAPLRCRCGLFLGSILEAMLHQVGEQPLRRIVRFNVTDDDGLDRLLFEFAKRSPRRWTWLEAAFRLTDAAEPLQ